MPSYTQISDIEVEDIMAELGIDIAPPRTGLEWVKALKSLLARQRKDFAKLLDYAAERPELIKECHVMRAEMNEVKRRIALHQMGHQCRN